MNKLLLAAILAVCFAVPALAEVDVKSEGTKITTAVAVDFYGPAVTKVGSKAVVDMTNINDDMAVDGVITLGTETSDPCGTKAVGSIFFNGNKPCFCNALGADVSIYDGSTACF